MSEPSHLIFFTLSPKLSFISRYIIDLGVLFFLHAPRSAREFAPPNCPTEISSNVATSHWAGDLPPTAAILPRSASVLPPSVHHGNAEVRTDGRTGWETPGSQVGLGEQVQWEGLAGAQILGAARVSARLITDVERRRFLRHRNVLL